MTTLGADEVALSFPFSFFSSFFLRVVADALTNAFCLAASISAKDKGQEVKHKDNKEEIERNKEGKIYDNGSIRSTYVL